jgi:hypothetical protein
MNDFFEEIKQNPSNESTLQRNAAEVNGKYLANRCRRARIWDFLEKRGWKKLNLSIDKRLMSPIFNEVQKFQNSLHKKWGGNHLIMLPVFHI